MKFTTWSGAYYVELEDGEEIIEAEVKLTESITLHPGDKIKKLGDKPRASFSMKEGWSLVFKGWFENNLLFDAAPDEMKPVQGSLFAEPERRIFYAFVYMSRGGLFVPSNRLAGYEINF